MPTRTGKGEGDVTMLINHGFKNPAIVDKPGETQTVSEGRTVVVDLRVTVLLPISIGMNQGTTRIRIQAEWLFENAFIHQQEWVAKQMDGATGIEQDTVLPASTVVPEQLLLILGLF